MSEGNDYPFDEFIYAIAKARLLAEDIGWSDEKIKNYDEWALRIDRDSWKYYSELSTSRILENYEEYLAKIEKAKKDAAVEYNMYPLIPRDASKKYISETIRSEFGEEGERLFWKGLISEYNIGWRDALKVYSQKKGGAISRQKVREVIQRGRELSDEI